MFLNKIYQFNDIVIINVVLINSQNKQEKEILKRLLMTGVQVSS